MAHYSQVPRSLWRPFDNFMRLGGHTKMGVGIYKKADKIYRFNDDGRMNSNLKGKYEIFLYKWLEGGKEYIQDMS
jgi:hypothetical protein